MKIVEPNVVNPSTWRRRNSTCVWAAREYQIDAKVELELELMWAPYTWASSNNMWPTQVYLVQSQGTCPIQLFYCLLLFVYEFKWVAVM